MIVEGRSYTPHPGQAPFDVAAYEAEGMPIQKRILGRMVEDYTTGFGPLNQAIPGPIERDSPPPRPRMRPAGSPASQAAGWPRPAIEGGRMANSH